MNDVYFEKLVHKKGFKYPFAAKAAIALSSFAVIMLSFVLFDAIVVAIIFAIAVFLSGKYLWDRLYEDFEYFYTNGELDFDIILNMKTRRRVMTLKTCDILDFSPFSSDLYEINKKSIKDFSSSKNWENRWIIKYKKPEGESYVVFEPSESMIAEMSKQFPER